MLNALRRRAKGTLAKLLIALLVLSFAVWGVADFVNTVNPTEVARAGETPVSAREFERAWRVQSARFAQQFGRALTPQEIQTFGLADSVLQALVTEALQVDAAHKIGIDVGDETLAQRIRNDPRFSAGGRFSRIAFERYLADFGYNEAEFVELERAATSQEMWANSLVGRLAAPVPYVEALNSFTNQTRSAAYFRVDNDDLSTIDDPAADELRAYYDANQDQFRSPERRTFTTLLISPEALAEPETVSDDAVQRAYEIDGAYGQPEKRRVQQVVLDDQETAQKAADAINEGYAFAIVLRQLGKKSGDVDLGLVTRGEIFDSAIADAAFGLEDRKATVVDGRFGPTLVRVAEIEPASKRPLEEVQEEIRQALALDEAVDQIRTLEVDVTDAVAGGAPLSEIGERFDLPLASFEALTREGIAEDGTAADVPGGQTALNAAFTAAAGDDANSVEVDDATVWVQTDTIIEAAVRPFEEVQTEVLIAWTEAKRAELLDALADEAVAAIEAGTPIAEVATQYGSGVTTTDPFAVAAPPEDLPRAVASATFEGGLGSAATVADGDTRIVLEVAEVIEPAFFEESADLDPIKQRLSQGMANGLLFDFLNAYQSEVGATVNQPIFNQITGLAPPQG